jgi:hypothetical protein
MFNKTIRIVLSSRKSYIICNLHNISSNLFRIFLFICRFLKEELLRQLSRKGSKRSETDHWLWPLLTPLFDNSEVVLETSAKVSTSHLFINLVCYCIVYNFII